LLRRDLKWRYGFLVPLPLIAALIPAWMAGRPAVDLLRIYVNQSSQYEAITMNAPSVYAWLPQTKQVFNLLYVPGVIAGAVAAFFVVVLIYEGRRRLTRALLLQLALLSVIVIPFFLPKMHERYFFPADLISFVVAIYRPRLFFLAALVNAVSLLAYEPFLFQSVPVPLAFLALALLVVIYVLFQRTTARRFSGPTTEASAS
jgi:Gpi18-like mannosyltransferase